MGTDGAVGGCCLICTGLCLYSIYALFSWLVSAGLFVFYSHYGMLLSITMFTTTVNDTVKDINPGPGDIICLSNGPVFKLQGQLNVSLKSDMLYSCFEDENVLYLHKSGSLSLEEYDPSDMETLCYFRGFGIVTAKTISRKASKYEDEAICISKGKLKLDTKRNTSAVPTKINLTSCHLQNVPSKFYTEDTNVERLEKSGLATCIVDVGVGFRVFLFLVWILRIFGYPFLILVCAIWADRTNCAPRDGWTSFGVINAIISSIELAALVISAVLPYLYQNSNLELTADYKWLLAINAVLFIISLVPLLLVMISSLNCRIRRKKATTQRPVMTLQQLPLPTATTQRPVMTLQQLPIPPVIEVQKKVQVWEFSPVTPAISREDVQETIGLLDDVGAGTATEVDIEIQTQDDENSTTVDISKNGRGEDLNDEVNPNKDYQQLVTKCIELRRSITRAKYELRRTTLALWNSEKVGIGRDARGLVHKNIEIVSVRKMNTPLPEQYTKRKHELMKYASCLPGGRIAAVQDFKENIAPVCTMEELSSETSVLRSSLNEEINEVLLFHGTKKINVASIERDGFNVEKCRSNYVGFGTYFAESPVKADQYTDKFTEESTMIVARVSLGKTALLKNRKYMCETRKPPCSTCLNINCEEEHRPRRRPFDSVVLARPNGLFREFVVYENCLAHPEYLITYKRV